jgi:hypothetical protein
MPKSDSTAAIPGGVKKPSDHKAKAKAAEGVTIEVQGLHLAVAAETLDDFELLDDLNLLNEGDETAALKLPRILRSFFGIGQYREIMEHLRDPETRRVSISAGVDFVGDMLKVLSGAVPN